MKNIKLRLYDIIMILILVLQDAGTFNVLPLNISQIISLFLLSYILILYLRKKVMFKISIKLLILLMYMCIITFINVFDNESVKSLVYFILELFMICLYINLDFNPKRIFKVLYFSAIILSFFAVIQYVGYILNLPYLYDFTNYGFSHNGTMIAANGLFRCSSLYAEPSHLNAILSAGLYVSLVNKYKKSSILLILAIIMTISLITYASAIAVVILYMFACKKINFKRTVKVFLLAIIVIMIAFSNTTIKETISSKVLSIFSATSYKTSDLSSFAIKSNLQVATEKLKNGYFFGTGFDSHRIYYDYYISNIYYTTTMLLNYDDAASIFIRVLSEFGIIGILYLIVLLVYNAFKAIKIKNYDFLFIVLLLILSGMRNGHYEIIITVLCFAMIMYKKIMFESNLESE